MDFIKIDKPVKIFGHERYCHNMLPRKHGFKKCEYLGSSTHENRCNLYKVYLNFYCDTPSKCDECKEAWKKAKEKALKDHYDNCNGGYGKGMSCEKCNEYLKMVGTNG